MPRPEISAILVDIDSTLYPMGPLLRRHMNRLYGVDLPEAEHRIWNFWEQVGLGPREAIEIIAASHAPDQILAQRPYPGAVGAIRSWFRAGAEIHIVSDRRPETVAPTLRWLHRIRVPYTAAVCEPRVDKEHYVAAHRIGLVIDDKPGFIEAMQRHPAVGIATLRHAYNLEVLARSPEVIAADDWPTLAARIDQRFAIGTRSGVAA